MRKIFLQTLLILVSCACVYAQDASRGGKPPWINGDMPRVSNKGTYKVINVTASNLGDAKEKAKEELVRNLLIEQGVTVESVSEYTNDFKAETNKNNQSKVHYHNQTRITTDTYKAVLAKVDEYYEYKNDMYNFWALYLVDENSKSIGNLPVMAYKLDNGAWRSIVVPGWAQFYQKRSGKGALLLGGEAAILASGFYFYSKYSSNNTKMKEASSVSIRKEYRNRANKYKTYSYISFGAAAGWYIYNIVDAFTSKKGKLQYDYGKMNISFYPSLMPNYDNNRMCMLATVRMRFCN